MCGSFICMLTNTKTNKQTKTKHVYVYICVIHHADITQLQKAPGQQYSRC